MTLNPTLQGPLKAYSPKLYPLKLLNPRPTTPSSLIPSSIPCAGQVVVVVAVCTFISFTMASGMVALYLHLIGLLKFLIEPPGCQKTLL